MQTIQKIKGDKKREDCIRVQHIRPCFAPNPVSNDNSLKFHSLPLFCKFLQCAFYIIKELYAEIYKKN